MEDRRILLVEDHEATRLYFRHVLEGLGCHVTELASGKGFLNAVSKFDPDLVLLDLGLPEGNGLDLLGQLRGLGPSEGGVPVFVITGDASEEALSTALLRGADGYLVKPVSRGELEWRTQGIFRLNRYRRILNEMEHRAQAERQSTALQEFLQAVSNAPGLILLRVDASMAIREANPSFERGFYPPGGNLLDALHPSDAAALEVALEHLTSSGAITVSLEGSLHHHDGTYHPFVGLASRTTLPPEGSGFSLLLILNELQEDRMAMMDRVSAAEEFVQLAAGAAHDLRNVMLVLEMEVGLLALDPSPEDLQATKRSVTDAVAEGKSLTELLTGGAAARRAEEKEGDEGCALVEALRMSQPYFKALVPSRIKLDVRIGEGFEQGPDHFRSPLTCQTILRILLNLVGNARDAIPEEGSIVVSLGRSDQLEDGAQLEVRDSGKGISPDVLPRIFEPGFTDKPPGKGSGFGLPVVRQLSRAAGGHVDVESSPGQGSVFRIHLPRQSDSLAQKAGPS